MDQKAIAVHFRIGDLQLGQALFPVYVAVLLWGGLHVRDRRVKTMIKRVSPCQAVTLLPLPAELKVPMN